MQRRVPTVAFVVDGVQSPGIAEALAQQGIFVWSGHNYALEAAAVLDLPATSGAVRIGPVHYNSLAEIDELLNALEGILPSRSAA